MVSVVNTFLAERLVPGYAKRRQMHLLTVEGEAHWGSYGVGVTPCGFVMDRASHVMGGERCPECVALSGGEAV